jgi:hypothetical protein
MKRTFALSPNTPTAAARGDVFLTLDWAARLRKFAGTGKARQAMDHLAALKQASWANDSWKRMGGRLP